MDDGWIKISRSITSHWLWSYTPFTYGQAWIDLLLLANYEDKKTLLNGKLVICKRGDVNLSIAKLAERWKWNRKTVRKFLDVLASDKMVALTVTKQRTTISIVNYDNFQCLGTTERATPRTTTGQRYGQRRDITKEIKEIKENKEIYIVVLDYLNEKAKKHFKVNDKNKALIDARINDGATLEDFKRVIDIKAAQWLNNPDMNGYLRPITLFSNKFESYLNEQMPEENKTATAAGLKNSFNRMQTAKYDFEELEGLFNG